MKRVVRFTLTAGAVALVCACRSDSTNPPIGRPLASFSDGAHSGNPDFFFLPPIFKDPSSNPNFSPGEFNAGVRPSVEICELALLVPPATTRSCGATIKTFAPADVSLDATNQLYQVNWNTTDSHLDVAKEYRIRVLLGTTELGYTDVDPVASATGLKRVDTGEFIGLVDGRTLPIKFRIENGAACNGGDCDSKTIDLSQGGFVVLATTGDRVDIPAQQSGQVVTVTVQQCADLDIDLPLFGHCLRATADPPLAARLAPDATVSICSLFQTPLPLVHAQQDLVTLHRQDGELVVALPHSNDFCPPQIGRAPSNSSTSLAARGWRALRSAAAWLFKPATLHASMMVLDVGAGGQTDGFSDFQFALPAKMEISSLADQATTPITAVPSAPEVLVTDADGNPVAGARVHFQITSSGGGSIAPAAGMVVSDGSGHAALTQWTLGVVGSHELQAYGRGIADPEVNGPAEGFDPFAPAVLHDPGEDEAQPPASLGTGHLTFSATALAPLLVRPVSSGLASQGVTLPLTQLNGITMQSGAAVQLEMSPAVTGTWSSSDPLGAVGSVNTTGLVVMVQENDDPAVAHELVVTASGTSAIGAIKINSYNFDHFPRFTTAVWRPVVGAATYEVELQFGNGCTDGTAVCTLWSPEFTSAPTTSLGLAFAFVGAQPGRWRVIARAATGAVLSTSEYVYFVYLH
ncbi:MAG TPA: Ig-like domain-containing protein [Gemmatimonadales bacterium]|jgi:hypothetical protein